MKKIHNFFALVTAFAYFALPIILILVIFSILNWRFLLSDVILILFSGITTGMINDFLEKAKKWKNGNM